MGMLLKRVYSLKEKTEMIDKLEMKIALKCFNSDFLERKLQGLKSIQELIKRTKEYEQTMQNSDIKFLTPQLMVLKGLDSSLLLQVEWVN
jgi:ubiquitin carboxyl-terminal hydrolase 34